MAKFNERLKLLRREVNLSQQEFAKQIGTSKSSVNMYERGEREPGLETLEAIADYFNVDMDYLIGKSDIKNKYALLKQVNSVSDCSSNSVADFPKGVMRLGEIIKKYRNENHITQDTFAKRCGISKSYVSILENGKTSRGNMELVPSIDVINNIAKAIGISVDELLNIIDPDQPIHIQNHAIPLPFDPMTIGERMKKRRKEIRFSAEKVAALLGVSPATIYRYEKGDIEKVPGDIIEPLSKILRTTPAYLMGWDETPALRAPAAAVARTKADNTTRMEFFEILRRLRENSNLDQADMALILGVERTVYNEWETGKTQPDFKTLLLLADYFDCTTDYLLGRVDEPDLIKKELPVQRSGELEAITIKKWASNDEEIIRVAQEAARRAIEDYKRDHNPD